MQEKENQYLKSNFKKGIVALTVILISWTPNAKADPMQDAVVKIGTSIISSVAGKTINEALFPTQGIDYEKIRLMMEKVIMKSIVSLEIDMVQGQLKGLNSKVHAAMFARGLRPMERYKLLEDFGNTLGLLVDRISGDVFGEDSIAVYLSGAQAELAIYASMVYFAKSSGEEGWAEYALDIFKTRLWTHYQQTSYIKETYNDLVRRRYRSVHCSYFSKYWLLDNWNGQQLVRNWYSDYLGCYRAYEQYNEVVVQKYVRNLKAEMAWMVKIKDSWLSIGQELNVL
jgi:hypothetical protein